jgi:hydrogenase maturation protein HypF
MCAACQGEYDDPLNRRFHAQPNACWDCGPTLGFCDRSGRSQTSGDPILETIEILRAGQTVAVKGLGGFHLVADATNAGAVRLLRERKRRVEKPFAIMVPSIQVAEEFCELHATERDTLLSIQHPIVLSRRRPGLTIADEVAPFNRYLGVFLPYTPLHHLLFAGSGFKALIMTSGNLSEEPIATDNDEARTRLSGLADYFLVHNREILLRCDDSVVRVCSAPWADAPQSKARNRTGRRENAEAAAKIQHLRRSRGYVPVPVFLHKEVPQVLAVGGELKNTVCLTKDKHAFLSQHIGDLENIEGYRFFEEAIQHLKTILEIEPSAIAYDLHPDYFSTKWALKQEGLPRIGVQHHHAHVASCMAENHLEGEVIGFALDGTGYGTDGNIWGGEVLIATYTDFRRAAHFEYVPMPGGSAVIREPWRMAISYLAHHFGSAKAAEGASLLRGISPQQVRLVLQMIERNVNSPMTSSCGRLFDAVASLAGIRQKTNYEAQPAIELEMAMDDIGESRPYPFELRPTGDSWIIGTRPLFESLLCDLEARVPVGVISARFHAGLTDILTKTAIAVRESTGLSRTCFSGGTFNNQVLASGLPTRLRQHGFEIFTQSEVPCGDGGLSLGQAMVAATKFDRGDY